MPSGNWHIGNGRLKPREKMRMEVVDANEMVQNSAINFKCNLGNEKKQITTKKNEKSPKQFYQIY